MKRYFVYQLKKNVSTFLVMALLFLVLVVPYLAESDGLRYAERSLYTLYIGLMAVSAALPAWTLRYRTDKRSCDLNFSMPIRRSKMLAARFLTGFMTLMAAFTVAYAVSVVKGATIEAVYAGALVSPGGRELNLIYYLPLYFATFVPVFVVYSISSFAFTRANSEADGIIFILFAMAVTGVVMYFLRDFVYAFEEESSVMGTEERLYKRYYISAEFYFPMSSLYVLADKFSALLSRGAGNGMTKDLDNILAGGILMCALSAGATAGMFLTEKDSRAENVGQPSESPFGYRVMTPLLACLGTSLTVTGVGADATLAIYVVLIAAAGYALEWAYRRSPRIGRKRAVILALAIAVGVGVGFLAEALFGKSYIVL